MKSPLTEVVYYNQNTISIKVRFNWNSRAKGKDSVSERMVFSSRYDQPYHTLYIVAIFRAQSRGNGVGAILL